VPTVIYRPFAVMRKSVNKGVIIMNLYIKIKDNIPVEHPIMENNLKACFPEIDLDNLPQNFAKFIRVQKPLVGVYEIDDGTTYEWDGNIVKDVHHIRQMTPQEKQSKINNVQQNKPYPSWIFLEETCTFIPPVSYPTDNKKYSWDESTLTWIENKDNLNV